MNYDLQQSVLQYLKDRALDKFEAVDDVDIYDALCDILSYNEDGEQHIPHIGLFVKKAMLARANAYAYGAAVANLWETSDADIAHTQTIPPAQWRAEMIERYKNDFLKG